LKKAISEEIWSTPTRSSSGTRTSRFNTQSLRDSSFVL